MQAVEKISKNDPYQIWTDPYSLKGSRTNHYTKGPLIIFLLLLPMQVAYASSSLRNYNYY